MNTSCKLASFLGLYPQKRLSPHDQHPSPMGGSFNGVFDSEVAASSPASMIEGVAAAAASTDAIVDETSVAADPVMNVRRSGILSAEDARVIDHAAVSASKFLMFRMKSGPQ